MLSWFNTEPLILTLLQCRNKLGSGNSTITQIIPVPRGRSYALVKKSDLNSVKSEMLFHVLSLFHRLFVR